MLDVPFSACYLSLFKVRKWSYREMKRQRVTTMNSQRKRMFDSLIVSLHCFSIIIDLCLVSCFKLFNSFCQGGKWSISEVKWSQEKKKTKWWESYHHLSLRLWHFCSVFATIKYVELEFLGGRYKQKKLGRNARMYWHGRAPSNEGTSGVLSPTLSPSLPPLLPCFAGGDMGGGAM